MGKYEWDISKLIEKRNELERMYNANKDELTKEQLEVYRDLVRNYDIRIDGTEISFDHDEDDEEFYPMDFFRNVIIPSVSVTQLDVVTGAAKIAKNYVVDLEPLILDQAKLNDEELVEITASLFSQIPNIRLYKDFLRIVNSDEHCLLIKYYSNLPTEDYGLAFVDPIKHKSFGLVARQNSMSDVITLAHEASHMILRKDESPFFWKTPKRMYGEVEGYFINLLFNDLLNQNGYQVGEGFNIKDVNLVLTHIQDVFAAMKVIEYSPDNKTNFTRLITELKKHGIETPISKENVRFLLYPEFREDLDSSSSYLVALDLYKQYQKDPERTIDSLYSIPLLGGEHVYQELEKIGVTFFEDGYQNLDNQCKKLLKEKPVH